jgi:cytochrome oxidase Cu insertion factor (SCO1/SenC/PrrC family)
MISKVLKARIYLIIILFLFTTPFIASWYLVFFTDFKKNDQGVEHGELIVPVLKVGPIYAQSINSQEVRELKDKWILTGFTQERCDDRCEQLLYKLRQIRLAIGKDIDKVDRLVISIDNLQSHVEQYKGQNIIVDPDERDRLYVLFQQVENFDQGSIFLIDPYGFLMMQYDFDAEPKGIIRDIERLIKNSK